MPRKYYDGKPFAYKINLFDREVYESEFRRRRESHMRMVVDGIGWKQRALDRIKMRFSHQIGKMTQQVKRPWYCYYTVDDYGAPSEREFLCPLTAMKARRIKESDALFYRTYYSKCILVSELILNWLKQLDPYDYTFELHQYLLRFVVVDRPSQHWVERYEKRAQAEISRTLRG